MFDEIFGSVQLSDEEKEKIELKFDIKQIKKGELLLKAGDITTHQYYVSSGCLRTFYIDDYTKEHTIQFAIHDWWISDYTAYYNSNKAIMNIECLKDATLYRIARKDLEVLFKDIPPLESFFRKKLENAFANYQKRILATLSQPAQKRYVSFLKQYPNIEKEVKNYHIASFLGITTQSLSRIRKNLAS